MANKEALVRERCRVKQQLNGFVQDLDWLSTKIADARRQMPKSVLEYADLKVCLIMLKSYVDTAYGWAIETAKCADAGFEHLATKDVDQIHV